jgi:AraC family transcriptional regulator
MLFSEQTPSNLKLQTKLEGGFFATNPFLCIRNLPGWNDIDLEYYQASSGFIEQKFQELVVFIFFSEGIVNLFYTCEQSFNLDYDCNISNELNCNEESLVKQHFYNQTESCSVIPGSIIVIPPAIFARINWLQSLDFAVLILKSSAREQAVRELNLQFDSVKSKPQFEQFDSLGYTLISSLFLEIDCDLQEYDFYTATLLKTLTIHLFQKYTSLLIQPSENLNIPPKIKQAIAYIQENIDRKLYIEEIAAVVNISKYYFCKLFRKSMGISPYQYLLQEKIEYSKNLLQFDLQLSLAEISLRCGFASQSHFSKCFRRYTGTTPKAYRGQLRCKLGDRYL